MRNNNTSVVLVLLSLVLAGLAGCGEKYPTVPTIAGPLTYCQDVKLILEKHCQTCHSAALQGASRKGAPVAVNFDSYQDAVARAGRIKARIQSGTMPPGGGVPADEMGTLLGWVDAGTLEGCNGDGGVGGDGDGGGTGGDPAGGITYCGIIQPLLELNCTGCHSSHLAGGARNGAPAGVDFDSYAVAVANATRANVRIQAGTMPLGGGLSAADRDLFAGWIAAGTPNCGGADGGIDGGDAGPTCTSGSHFTVGAEPDGLMRPGENCGSCHNDVLGPPLAVGGTVMGALHDEDDCVGVPGVTVEITHSGGTKVATFTTNANGNFSAPLEDTTRLVPPFTVRLLYQARERVMPAAQTDVFCNTCHATWGDDDTPGRVVAP